MPAQKKYICGFCARAFTRSEHKQRHERSHTNEKPFHCHYCTSAFVRRDLLQRHCRTVHNIRLVSRKEDHPSPNSSNLPISPADSEQKIIKSDIDSNIPAKQNDSPLLPNSNSLPAPNSHSPKSDRPSTTDNPISSPTQHQQNNHPPRLPHPFIANSIPSIPGPLISTNAAVSSSSPNNAKLPSLSPRQPPLQNTMSHSLPSNTLPPPFRNLSNAQLAIPFAQSNSTALSTCDESNPYSYTPTQNGRTPRVNESPDNLLRLPLPSANSLASSFTSFPSRSSGNGNGFQRARAASFNDHTQFSQPMFPGHSSISAPTLPTALSSISPKSVSHDTINLLSVVASLERFYSPEDVRFPVNDMFLLGYPVIATENHPVLHGLLASLVDSLHASLLASTAVNEFQLGIIYCVLSVGSLSMPPKSFNNEDVATYFINRSWAILVEKLSIANSTIETQCEILKNFFILAYVYLRFFNNDLMISHLERSVDVILQNFLASTSDPASLATIEGSLPVLWSIYVLVSKCRINSPPPKFYSWFLGSKLEPIHSGTLGSTCQSFANASIPVDDPFLNDIIISTLGNEVNNFVFNNTLWIFDSHASLHNALIHTQQSISMKACPMESNKGHGSLFDILKAKLVTSSPIKYRKLLESYVFKITSPQHWNMLLLTLREVNAPFTFHNFMKDNVNASFQDFGNNLLKFLASDASLIPFAGLASTVSIFNNNLGMVSYPLLFQYNILSLNNVEVPFDVKSLNTIDFANLNNLILEWYITVVKVLVVLITKHTSSEVEEFIMSNPVLLCLFYMITRELPSIHPVGTAEYCLLIFEQLSKVCDVWFNFINKTDSLNNLKSNLNRFLSDLVVLALNNEGLALDCLYVANESILVKNRRSKSIGSVELSSGLCQLTSLSSVSSRRTTNSNSSSGHNYVLMNKGERAMSGTLTSFSGSSRENIEREIPPMTATPITPGPAAYILPPINAPAKTSMKPGHP